MENISNVVILFLGFIELPGLTTEDHVTLTIIERYLDFKVILQNNSQLINTQVISLNCLKQKFIFYEENYLFFCKIQLGEVWSEIQQELSEEKIEPITPDQEALEAICRTIEDRATHVLDIQRELLDAQNQQDLLDEQEYYAQVD